MKKAILVCVLGLFAFVGKELTVTYSLEKWQEKVNFLNQVTQIIDKSDIPAQVRVPVRDSLQSLTNDLLKQLQGQAQESPKK